MFPVYCVKDVTGLYPTPPPAKAPSSLADACTSRVYLSGPVSSEQGDSDETYDDPAVVLGKAIRSIEYGSRKAPRNAVIPSLTSPAPHVSPATHPTAQT